MELEFYQYKIMPTIETKLGFVFWRHIELFIWSYNAMTAMS